MNKKKMSISRRLKILFYKLMKTGCTPHELALSFSIGVFIACLPVYLFHTLLGLVCAGVFRLNILAMMTGVFTNNPFTMPLIILISYLIGDAMHRLLPFVDKLWLFGEKMALRFLPLEAMGADRLQSMEQFPENYLRVQKIISGGVLLGLFCSLLSYQVFRFFASAYQKKKKIKKLSSAW